MFNRSSMAVSALTTAVLFLGGCAPGQSKPEASSGSLADARQGIATRLLMQKKTPAPLAQPPAGFELVHYAAPLGSFPAYVATVPDPAVKHPAIVWISGGFDNSIGDTPWAAATPDNDQSARAFPKAGIVTMYPSLRGGNNNPGYLEGLYGEVDDVIAAGKYLAGRPDVDPKRVYLGGHSTGGTLVLLTAESTHLFRAVFAFGPVSRIEQYGSDDLPFDINDRQETSLRSPVLYLSSIISPTFVFEGTTSPSNIEPVRDLFSYSSNTRIHFYQLPGLTHFTELAPITPVIAAGIVKDTGSQPHFSFLSQNPEIKPVDR